MNRKGDRRSHAKSRGEQGPFWIESMGAFRDFARLRPEALLDVHCSAALKAEVDDILQTSGVSIAVQNISGSSSASLKAFVKIKPQSEQQFKEADRSQPQLVVACDHITDPRNFGAIIRTAAFFGVRHILAPTKRQVLLTQSVVATSMAGLAYTSIVQVGSLARTLTELQQDGFAIVGADGAGERLGEGAPVGRRVLVLGSEEKGLSASVREVCSHMVRIGDSEPNINSLNVSVAAGILINHLS